MGDLLDKLGKENRRETKQIKLQNPDLTDYLLQNLEEIFKFACRHNPLKEDIPGEISRKTSHIYASTKDIELLCSKIKDFENKANFAMWAGMYINDLINNSKDNEFALHIRPLDKRIEFIGAYNKGKNIQVIGNLGNEIGFLMKSGYLNVNGNTNIIGQNMSGGTIIVNGYCNLVGLGMRGGEIYCYPHKEYDLFLKNEILDSFLMKRRSGGNIYVNDKLIIKNGRLVK